MNLKTKSFLPDIAVLAAGVPFIFIVPWLFPPARRVVSASYDLGFNNVVAVLGIGVTTLLLCLLRFYRLRNIPEDKHSTNLATLFNSFQNNSAGPGYKLLIVLCLIHCLLLFAWFFILPFSYFGEMTFGLSRIDLALLGQEPYRDFHYIYGPLYLYFPVALVRLSGNTLSPDLAYLISLATFTVIGISLVFYVVKVLNLSTKHKTAIFLLLVLPGANLSMGMNYTFVRFILPYFLLFALHRRILPSIEGNERLPYWRLYLETTLAGALAFWLSPETGIAFAAAICVYYWLQFKAFSFAWRLCGLLSVAGAVASLGLFSSSYLMGFVAFINGGNNFPVVPSFPVLFFLASLFALVPVMATFGLKQHSPQAALAAALAVVMIMMVAPVLGRCDLGHIFFNGLGVFIFSLALSSMLAPRLFAYYAILYFFLFGVTGQIIFWFQYANRFVGAIELRQAGGHKPDRNFLNPKSPADTSPALASLQRALSPYRKVGTPLGCTEEVEMFLKRNKLYVPEYHPMPYPEILTEANLARTLAGIRKMPTILVPVEALEVKPGDQKDYERGNSALLTVLLLYPIDYHVIRKPLIPRREVQSFVRQNFIPLRKVGFYLLMTNKTNPTPLKSSKASSVAELPSIR